MRISTQRTGTETAILVLKSS